MTENIEDNKDSCKASNIKKSSPLLSVTFGVLTSLFCGFILATILAKDRALFVHFLCNCLVGLCIGIAVSYGVKKNRYNNRKVLFLLIVLCALLTYLVFNIALYNIAHGYYKSYKISFVLYVLILPIKSPLDYYYPLSLCSEKLSGIKLILFTFANTLTGGMFTEDSVARIINMTLWVIQLLMTVYCAGMYITYTCPWLSSISYSIRQKNEYYFMQNNKFRKEN